MTTKISHDHADYAVVSVTDAFGDELTITVNPTGLFIEKAGAHSGAVAVYEEDFVALWQVIHSVVDPAYTTYGAGAK